MWRNSVASHRCGFIGAYGNDAHAQVEHTPGTMTKNKFRKLKEALAFLANQKDWVIKPGNR